MTYSIQVQNAAKSLISFRGKVDKGTFDNVDSFVNHKLNKPKALSE